MRPNSSAQPKAAQHNSTEEVIARARDPFDISSLTQGGPDIEIASESDKPNPKNWTDPAFLNELIAIKFLDTGNPNDPKAVELQINTLGLKGKTGGKSLRVVFMRNVVYRVPRFIFEVVAHAKTTTLQPTQDPKDPMNTLYIEKHSFYYPCQVVADANPDGPAWCEKVLNDPA